MKNKALFKTFKILLIVLSCSTLFFAFFIVMLNEPKNPLASFETTYSMIKYMWTMWLFLPITIGCLAFGIVMKIRKMKTVSNIVIGSIFSVLLLIYGSFTSAFIGNYNTDFSYWKEIGNTLNLNLPDEMSVLTEDFTNGTQTTTDSFLIRYESLARFNSKKDCQTFKTSLNNKWTSNYINNSIPYSFSFEVRSDFDKYLIYCFETNEYNPSSFVSGNRYICIAFSEAKTGLVLCDYKAK